LPALKSTVTGSSGKMVQATMPKKEGGFTQFFISLKTKEVAKEFSDKYNESLPS
jgi:phage FluMu gp28-like protein